MKNSISILKVVVVSFFIFGGQSGWCEDFTIKYHTFAEPDTRVYEIELLHEVMKKTVDEYGPYTMQPSRVIYNPARAEIELKKGKELNVYRGPILQMTMLQDYITIPIPLMKGLLGYRILLINRKDQQKFAAIKTLDELKQLRVGQGLGWGDVPILEHNGFTVVTGKEYESLFKMLIAGRFDFFSRGIGEAPPEYNLRKDKLPDLWIEENILLYYPYPVYFFVNKQHPKIAERMERGLRMMMDDGSFDDFFWKYHKPIIDQAKVKGRRLFTIENPFLPPGIDLDNKKLWIDLTTYGNE
jgi:hypothetical protein